MPAKSWDPPAPLIDPHDDGETYDDAAGGELFIASLLEGSGHGLQEAMHASLRQIFGKVEILYTDIFRDVSTILTVSSSGRYTQSPQLVDSVLVPAHKWFSLHENILDGSFHPIPNVPDTMQVGWWGTEMSDANGNITPASNWVNVTFSTRSFTSARLVGDALLNVYPVDFTFYCYGAGDILLATLPIIGNTDIDWAAAFTPILNVERVRIEFSKINKPDNVLKLIEVSIAIREVYEGALLQSFSYLSEIGYATGSLPMGNISANEIDISILNQDRRFDLKNTSSPLYGYVKRNRQVTAWLGVDVDDVREWHQLGKFWTSSWDIPRGSLFTGVTARDRLDLLRSSDFDTSQVYINNTLYQLFDTVLTDGGVYAEGYIIDPAMQDIIIPYAWFGKMKHRDALAKLAGCAIVQVYCNKDGNITVDLNLPTTAEVVASYYDNRDIFTANYPTAVTEQTNSIEVSYMAVTVNPVDVIYSTDVPVVIPANEVVVHEVIFNNDSCFEITAPIVTVTGSITVTDVDTFCWGARITFTNAGAAGTVNTISISGKYVSLTQTAVATVKDDKLVREDGLIKATVSSDFIQDQVYAGELAAQLLDIFKISRFDITMNNRGNISVNPGDQIEVDIESDPERYSVTRQQLTFSGYLEATTEARKI